MNSFFLKSAAAMLAFHAVLTVTTPAFATNAREAIRLCDKNPKCSFTVRDNGSVDITVDGNYINCPQEGECTCDICNHPSGIKSQTKPGLKLNVPRVTDVLKR